MASRVTLCLNSGSSSLNFSLYQIGDEEEIRLAEGAVERRIPFAPLHLPDGFSPLDAGSGAALRVAASALG